MVSLDQIGGQIVLKPTRQAGIPGRQAIDVPELKLPSGNVRGTIPLIKKVEATQLPERLSVSEMAKILNKVNLRLDLFAVTARFSINEGNGGIEVEVVDTSTGEVLRKIPPYEAVELLTDFSKDIGLLIDQMG